MSFEMRAAALLFDLDGTLVDSTSLITRAWTRWAQEEGLTRESFAGVALHGRPARDIVHDCCRIAKWMRCAGSTRSRRRRRVG